MGDLALNALEVQLQRHERHLRGLEAYRKQSTNSFLHSSEAAKISQNVFDNVEMDPEAFESIPLAVLKRALGDSCERLPYTALCRMKQTLDNKEEEGDYSSYLKSIDIDEWYVRPCSPSHSQCYQCLIPRYAHLTIIEPCRILKNEDWLRKQDPDDWK